jgi:hypothetical protein
LIDHCDEFLVRPRSWEASGGVPANESHFKGKMMPGQVSAKIGRRRIEWQMNCSNQPLVVVLTDGLLWRFNNSLPPNSTMLC